MFPEAFTYIFAAGRRLCYVAGKRQWELFVSVDDAAELEKRCEEGQYEFERPQQFVPFVSGSRIPELEASQEFRSDEGGGGGSEEGVGEEGRNEQQQPGSGPVEQRGVREIAEVGTTRLPSDGAELIFQSDCCSGNPVLRSASFHSAPQAVVSDEEEQQEQTEESLSSWASNQPPRTSPALVGNRRFISRGYLICTSFKRRISVVPEERVRFTSRQLQQSQQRRLGNAFFA